MRDSMALPNTAGPTEPQMSTAETLSSIFFEPSRTFEALRARPRFLVAGLIILIVVCLTVAVLFMRVDMGQFIRERIERSPNAAQQTEQQKEIGVKFGKIIAAVGVPLSVPITIAGGAALYLLGAMMMGGTLNYRKALSVWTYSSLPPAILTTLIAILVLFLKAPDTVDPEHLAITNPGALMGSDASPVLVAALTQFDILRFYGLFLAAVGLRKVGKLSSGSAWTIVIGLWVLAFLVRVGSAALFGR